jgi:N-acetylglucosaminyl-diphospho-decaprenol L-rhamnosyltransferase
MPALTTIIVNYNTRPELLDCLASIDRYPLHGDHEVIVVDNASTDGSVAAIHERFPAVTVIEAGRNLGFGGANNVGIRAATGEMCLLLNSDTRVKPDALDRLTSALRHDAGLVAVGPRIVDGDGRPELSFGRMISPWTEFTRKLSLRLYERGWGPAVRWADRLTRRPCEPDWVTGACLLAWRHDLLAVGMFDERYFLYTEDVDLCAALRGLGRRIGFRPEAEIVHLRGRSGCQRPEATERAYRQSQIRFYRKHHPRWARLLEAYLRLRGKMPERPV